MRADAASEHGVAVVEQMVRGDGGGDVARRRFDELHRLAVVMCSNTTRKRWKRSSSGRMYALDEYLLRGRTRPPPDR